MIGVLFANVNVIRRLIRPATFRIEFPGSRIFRAFRGFRSNDKHTGYLIGSAVADLGTFHRATNFSIISTL